MFERFTERARQVVVLAHDEARSFKLDTVSTDCLLLGLLREEAGIAAKVLADFTVTYGEVRGMVAEFYPEGDYPEECTEGQLRLTPKVKSILELALREALGLGHNYIGTEHILLGLIREPKSRADAYLSFFVSSEEIRDAVIERLRGPITQNVGSNRHCKSCTCTD